MNKLNLSGLGALVFGLILSGCGGGGSSNNNDQASSAISSSVSSVATSSSVSSVATSSSISSVPSSSASSSSVPTVTQLTIQGSTAVDALAEGEVVFTIGTTDYTAPINDSLNYSITLDVPQQDADKPFVAVATGNGVDSWVQLATSFPSVNNLIEKAGSDKVLNFEEHPAVNITTFTTAQYADIKNQLVEIESDEIRKNAFFKTHPVRSIEKAALVARMLSDTDFTLPPPAQTTLDFMLDENLSEAYLEANRIKEPGWLRSQVGTFLSDMPPSIESSDNLSGTYFLELLNNSYMLDFNDDGTGRLKSASINTRIYTKNPAVNAEFTWVRDARQINIQFTQPIVYPTEYYYLDDVLYYCDNPLDINEPCNVVFSAIDLELVTNIEFGELAYISHNIHIVSDGITIEGGVVGSQLARLINANDFHPVVRSDISNHEWYTNHHRYVFFDNGTASKTDLITKAEENLDWQFQDNNIVMGSETLWIAFKNIAGYDIIAVDDTSVVRKQMFKRNPVNMDEAAWIGRWQSYPFNMFSTIHDVNADKTWRDGFEAEGAGNWLIVNEHKQTAIANANWRMDRDVIAIHNDKYYLSICQGTIATNFVPFDCYLSIATKTANFDSNVFWAYWSYPAFNEQTSGNAWLPIEGNVHITDESGQTTVEPFVRVSVNKLFSTYDEMFVEMTSAGKDHIELCEYKMFETCDESDKQIYERGIEVELVVIGQGAVSLRNQGEATWGTSYSRERPVFNIFMMPKYHAQELVITTNGGDALDPSAVTGCDGTLDGMIYTIPARTEACQLTVNFEE